MFFNRTALIKQEKIENVEDEINYAQIYIKRTNSQFKELQAHGTYQGARINKNYRGVFEENMKDSLKILEVRLEDKNKELAKLRI